MNPGDRTSAGSGNGCDTLRTGEPDASSTCDHVVRRAHHGRHLRRGEPEIVHLAQLLFDDVGRGRADRREALVELLEQQPPVQPQDSGAEDRDGEHEQHRVPGGQAGAKGESHGVRYIS